MTPALASRGAELRAVSAPRLWLVLQLVVDYADDLQGMPQGLTAPELHRAWMARHGMGFPTWALGKLQQQGYVYDQPRRVCIVSGQYLPAWMPTMPGVPVAHQAMGRCIH